jgi:hypothetical protein
MNKKLEKNKVLRSETQSSNWYKEIINLIIDFDQENSYNRQKTIQKCMKRLRTNQNEKTPTNLRKLQKLKTLEIKRLAEKKCLFIPSSKFSQFWQSLITLILFYVTFMLTFELSFVENSNLFFRVSEYVTSFAFVFDIFFNFNLAYYNSQKKLVTNRKKIIISYIKFWFWLDLVSAFPFYLISDVRNTSFAQNLKSAKIFKYLKIVRLARLVKFIRRFCPKSQPSRNDYHSMKLRSNAERLSQHLLFALIVSHFFACIFYVLPTKFHPQNNWVVSRNLTNKASFEKYLFSMHWMVETVITVGYGENPIQ